MCGKYGCKVVNCWVKNNVGGKVDVNENKNSSVGGHKFTSKCYYCDEAEHHIIWCHKKKTAEEKGKVASNEEKCKKTSKSNLHSTVLNESIMTMYAQMMAKTFMGASPHITNNDGGIFDVKINNEMVNGISGTAIATKL